MKSQIQQLDYVRGAHLYFVLGEHCRKELFAKIPPTLVRPVAHHVTLIFALTETRLTWFKNVHSNGLDLEVVGIRNNLEVEVLEVRVNGSAQRSDGDRFYHLTYSLAAGIKPAASNQMFEAGVQGRSLVPIKLTGTLQMSKT